MSKRVKPETKLKLTKRNAAAEKFVNGFLKEFLYLGSGCAFLLDGSRADKSSIAPKVVINNTAPGPPSGTLFRTVDVVDVVGAVVCAWARTGRIKVAAAKAQALPIWL